MPEFSRAVIDVARHVLWKRQAQEQVSTVESVWVGWFPNVCYDRVAY